jgi:hypothetical protein
MDPEKEEEDSLKDEADDVSVFMSLTPEVKIEEDSYEEVIASPAKGSKKRYKRKIVKKTTKYIHFLI